MAAKPKLLDLFCGAGGAAMGYAQAGFEVTGVDIARQKHFPFSFIQANALDYVLEHGSEYNAIHASPPCQKYSAMTRGRWQDREHPDLVALTRLALMWMNKLYIIENVPGAPLHDPIMLCGTMFGLQTPEGSQLRRHRLFEASFPINVKLLSCRHNDGSAIGVYGGGQHPDRRRPATIGVWGHGGGDSHRDGLDHYKVADRRQVMQIDWMTQKELSQAIPPAYTRFIGEQLREML